MGAAETSQGRSAAWSIRALAGVLLWSSLVLPACSTLSGKWYSDPENEYEDETRYGDPCASLTVDGIEHQVWSETQPHSVSIGPVCVPVIPNGPENVDLETITMQWAVRPIWVPGRPDGHPKRLTVDLTNIGLTSGDGEVYLPTTITTYTLRPWGARKISEYYGMGEYGKKPGIIEITEDMEFELAYEARYSAEDEVQFTPQLMLDGVAIDTPAISFEPDTDYEYEALVSPFFFPGVR